MDRLLIAVEAQNRWVAVFVAALVLVAGTGYVLHLEGDLRYHDEREYYDLAVRLAETGRYILGDGDQTAFRAPAYPIALAALHGVGGGIPLMRLFNYALLAVSVLLIADLARRHYGGVAAAVAPVLLLGYPALFYTASTLYPQTLAGFFLLLFLFVSRPSQWGYRLLAGIVYGALILTVPVFLLLAPLAVWWAAGWRGRDWALVAGGVALMVAPWTARNYSVFGAFVPVATNSGVNLWAGNNLYTTPQSGVRVAMPPEYYAWIQEQKNPLDEIGRSDFYAGEAQKFMREHKARFISLYVRKFLNYFNYHNKLATAGVGLNTADWIMLFSFGPLLFLGCGRLILAAKWRLERLDWFCLAFYLISAATYALFFTRIRFRLPFDLLLIAVVAGFLGILARQGRDRG